ncbi:MAG: hypothetical protein U0P81_13595 [Holophagaceae bacterium]
MLPAILLLLAQAPPAQPAPPVPQARPQPGPGHHQFDFWVGVWEVRDPSGKVVGHSRIEAIAGGFGILEHWRGAGGGEGKSLNAYDPATERWHQSWVGQGGLIQFEGTFAEGRMRLEGRRTTPKGPLLDRMTWTPQADGSVVQVWENSVDEGKTWTKSFEGIYRKAKGATTP